MKKKELKNLAKKIAELELKLRDNPSHDEAQRIQNEIFILCNKVHTLDEIDILDEMIQQFIANNS